MKFNFLKPKYSRQDYPLFIFLPGMDGSGELLSSQLEGLEELFDVRCLAIPLKDLSNWEHLTHQVISLIKQELTQTPRKKVYLCGESFGGCLALKIVEKIPQLFAGMILINPASSFNQRPLFYLGIPITFILPDLIFHYSTLVLLPFLAAFERIANKEIVSLLNVMKSVPPQIVAWRLSLLKDFTLKESCLRKFIAPVLIIASASDRLLPSVEEAERLKNIFPKAMKVILPNSGHTCLLETDIKLVKILKHTIFKAEKLKQEIKKVGSQESVVRSQ